MLGGYLSDRMNRRLSYALAGGITALAALGMAAAPRTPLTYAIGTLSYSFANGIAFAAFAGLVLEMVSHGAAVTTKYTLYTAVSNLAESATHLARRLGPRPPAARAAPSPSTACSPSAASGCS